MAKSALAEYCFLLMFLTWGSLQSIPHHSQNTERETLSFCLHCESSNLGQPSEKVTMYYKYTCDRMAIERKSSDICFQKTGKTEQEEDAPPTQAVTTTFHFKLKPSFNLIWKPVSAQHWKRALNRKCWTASHPNYLWHSEKLSEFFYPPSPACVSVSALFKERTQKQHPQKK